jgi:predicted RND superfamily exporter protein
MLEKIARAVVHHRRLIIGLYLAIVVICFYGLLNVQVNYDIFSYLPKNLSSVKGFNILQKEFELGNQVQVVLPVSDVATVNKYISQIENIEGIKKVDFVTSFIDELTPLEFADENLVKNYVKEGYSLLRVSFEESANSPQTERAFVALKEITDDYQGKIAGIVATNYDMKQEIQSSLKKFALSALVFVSIVLLLSIHSFVVPLTFVAAIGTSAVINIGLTYCLGRELSYFARVIAIPLQFAVTMDYALFLYHRYEEEKNHHYVDQAMVNAIQATFKSIFTAAATTIAGFLALTAMKLGYGKDLGLTLARGVLLSLFTIVTLLPALLLEARSLIEKFRHRIVTPNFTFLGEFSAKHAIWIFVVLIVVFVGSLYLYSQVELSFDFKSGIPETAPSQRASELMSRVFDIKTSAYIIYENPDEKKMSIEAEKIKRLKYVTGVFGYATIKDPVIPDFLIPAEVKESFFKDKYTYEIINFDLDSTDSRLSDIIKKIRRLLGAGKVYLTGETVMLEDLKKIVFNDIDRINFYSTFAIFLIVLLAFKSVSIPIVLIGVIETAILLNQGLYSLVGRPMTFIGALAIGAIQLGSTVDYAVLLTTRFEEELKKGNRKLEAIIKSVKESTQSILVSAATMFAATFGMYVFGTIGTIKELGMLISRGALISFLAVTIFLPAVLYLFQPLFVWTSLNWPKGGK